jgi:uncharacterized membrane protein YcaP (DUF421 family)
MLDIVLTVARGIASLTVLFILTRILGKKQISQLTYFDYTVGITIGTIAGSVIVDRKLNFIAGLTALIVCMLFALALSYISLLSYKARKLLEGQPTVLVQNGKPVEANMAKVRFSMNDLLGQCRLKNVFDPADLETAVLETNGEVSVQPKPRARPLTPKDMNMPEMFKGLSLNLIIDGQLIRENLELSGKTEDWLIKEINMQHIKNRDDVYFGFLDASGQPHFYIKSKTEEKTPAV